MSRAIRTPDEALDLEVANLRRRVQDLERAGAGLVCIAQLASAPLVLTGSFVNVPGTTVAITKPGRYFAIANGDLAIGTAAAGSLSRITITATGAATSLPMDGYYEMDSVRPFLTRMCFGTYTFTTAGTLTMQGRVSAGAATIVSSNSATGIIVIRTGSS